MFNKIQENASIEEVIMEISSKRLGATAVVNNNNQLVGIITDGDIRRMLSKTPEIAAIKDSDIMGTKPKKIAFDAMAIDALNTMEANNISQILVVNDKKKYVGVIHIHDLIKEGIF